MARAPVESLVERRYRHDLDEWAAWRQQQARLRRLAGRALDASDWSRVQDALARVRAQLETAVWDSRLEALLNGI